MQKKLAITVTMLVKNSEKYLAQSLASLQDFAEIIVLDNGSTDSSLDIAAKFPNVSIYKHDFIGFGPLKNLAASYATNDWLLNIDSDEILTKELVQELRSLDFSDEKVVYSILRLNHYRGELVKVCGQYPDYVKRLYNKKYVAFNNLQVHESLELSDDIKLVKLKTTFLHYSFNGAADLITKMQQYTSLYAEQNKFKKPSSMLKALSHGFTSFLKNYLFKKGIFAGSTGLTLSIANASGSYYKYVKLYEANKSLTTTLIITTYNRPDALSAVLNSVLFQHELPSEVIVADDGSSEETLRVIQEYQKDYPIPLIHTWQEDTGFRAARSRNLALAKSTSDYIIIIDGDMILHPDFIADHKRYAKLGIFIQGGRIILPDETTQKLLLTPKQYQPMKWYQKGMDKRFEKRFLSCHIPWITKLCIKPSKDNHKGIRSCNMSFFIQDAMDINGFNNRFIGWGREDSEFVARLYNNGVRRINLKFAAIAYHLWHFEASRAALPHNDLLLNQALDEKLIRCDDGVEQV